jgi:serine/threonine-protein kinase
VRAAPKPRVIATPMPPAPAPPSRVAERPPIARPPSPPREPVPERAPARVAADAPPRRAKSRRPAAAPAAVGLLTLETQPWGTVYLDGRRLGTTPFARVSLPAGAHTLSIDVEDSGRRRPLRVQVAPRTETRLALQVR